MSRCAFYALPVGLLAALLAVMFAAAYGALGVTDATVYSSIALSLLFPTVPIAYMVSKGGTPRSIVRDLGLSRDRLAVRYMMLGIGLFAFMLAVEFGVAGFEAATGISLPTNVAQALGGLPLYFYVFTFTIAPIDEEILFRGFLVPRVGVFASSVLFAAVHYISYFSVAEVLAAFLFGLASGYALKRTKSLYPSVIGHALVNLLGIAATFL